MPYDHNRLTADTDAQHSERAHTLAIGIGTHGVDLGFDPLVEIPEMEGYADIFDAALSVQIEEAADVDAIFVALQNKADELHVKYVAC